MAPIGSVFSARVVFRAGDGDTALYWYCNHEFSSANPVLSDIDISVLASALGGFHRNLLLNPFYVDRIILSSYAEDGKPYDPESFAVRTINQRGLLAFGTTVTDALPLNQVLRVRRDVQRGRPGAMLLRGLLAEGDITSDPLSGRVTLADQPGLQTLVSDAYAALDDSLNVIECQMVMARGPESDPFQQLRNVETLTVVGLGQKQLRNKVSPRYGGGLFGDILRAIDAVKESAPALEAIAEALNALGFLLPLLAGAAADPAEASAVKGGPQEPLAKPLTE